MSVRIRWRPVPAADITHYEVQRADNLANAPWAVVALIASDFNGTNYDAVNNFFFFNDPTGDSNKFYRLVSIDRLGQRSVPSAPFQAVASTPGVTNNVRLDHNYGTAGGLRYQAANGMPIEMAVIRVFRKSDFDQGRRNSPLATTFTNSDGNWVDPIFVTTGFTYVVQFAKEGLYGPDHVEVIA